MGRALQLFLKPRFVMAVLNIRATAFGLYFLKTLFDLFFEECSQKTHYGLYFENTIQSMFLPQPICAHGRHLHRSHD